MTALLGARAWGRCSPILTVLLFGCGPMTQPMVIRVPPEKQNEIDESWDNMLTPSDRLDRSLLLDTLINRQMYQIGIDQLEMTSRKRVRNGLVVMRVYYDRDNPQFDAFTITLIGDDGERMRSERYTREEVEASVQFFVDPGRGMAEQPETGEQSDTLVDLEVLRAEREQQLHRLLSDREKRMEEIWAATQPATGE